MNPYNRKRSDLSQAFGVVEKDFWLTALFIFITLIGSSRATARTETAAPQPSAQGKVLNVYLDDNGNIRLRDSKAPPTSMAQIHEAFATASDTEAPPAVVFHLSDQAPGGRLPAILNAASSAGLTDTYLTDY